MLGKFLCFIVYFTSDYHNFCQTTCHWVYQLWHSSWPLFRDTYKVIHLKFGETKMPRAYRYRTQDLTPELSTVTAKPGRATNPKLVKLKSFFVLFELFVLFSSPTIRRMQSIQGQTCHGCINHDMVVGLFLSSCLWGYPNTSIYNFGKSFRLTWELSPGPSDP